MWFHRSVDSYDLDHETQLKNAQDYADPEQTRHYRIKGMTLGGLLLIGMAILIGLYSWMLHSSPLLGPYQHWVILVDTSDALSDNQQRALESSLRELHRRLRIGDRLSLYVMTPGDTDGLVKLLFDRSRPKRGNESDPFRENPKHNEKAYEETFVRPFEQALRELVVARPAKTSPLLEAIYGLSKATPLGDPVAHREFLIWSDMMQHSALLSQYKPGYRIDQVKNSAYLDIATLQGAEVTVYQLTNQYQEHQKRPEHRRFWCDYFKLIGVPESLLHLRQI